MSDKEEIKEVTLTNPGPPGYPPSFRGWVQCKCGNYLRVFSNADVTCPCGEVHLRQEQEGQPESQPS